VRHLGFPVVAALTVSVVAVSSSAPLTAYALAPALAIAFWRNALAVGVLAPVAVTRGRAQLVSLAGDRRTAAVCLVAGVALAAHFATWLPSTRLTSVATATALVSTMPVWSALIATFQGTRLPRTTWIGIAVAVAGAVLATGADLTVSGRAVAGDALALLGGFCGAAYAALGERARSTLTTTTYTTVCYSTCAVIMGVVCVAAGVPLHGYPGSAWLAILGITLGAQLLGHSLINFTLDRVSATTVSVLLLLEVPGAALLAWWWLDQLPEPASLPGLAVLTAGVLIVLLGSARRGGQPTNGGTAISPDAIATT
jgi:drug/metabolite transporter (DMT)-like permease